MPRLGNFLLLLFSASTAAWCSWSEAEKPVFTLGVLGPFTLQQFYIILFDLLAAKLDFESSNPIIHTDLAGRMINSSCFGVKLVLADEAGNKDLARNLALQLCQGDACGSSTGTGTSISSRPSFSPIVGLVGGQVPSNCADSAQITSAFRVPQMAWGCAMPLTGSTGYFTRTHQMDFPLAFVAMWKSFGWTRVTVVWEPSESFSLYNFYTLRDGLPPHPGLSASNVTLHEVRLERLPDGQPDFTSWTNAFDAAKLFHDRVWLVLTGPATSKVLIPYMLSNNLIQPWMQLVGPGSTKSSFIGAITSDPAVKALLAGTLIVRPLSYHTVGDAHHANSFFSRMAARSPGDFRNSATAFGIDFDPVDLADAPPRGNGTTASLLSNPGSLFSRNHNWPLAYDALYSFLFAIDELLRSGSAVSDIQGAALLEAVRRQQFNGMSQDVSFDSDMRGGDWAIENLLTTPTGFKSPQVGRYGDGILTWNNGATITWMTDGATPFDAAASGASSSSIISDRQLRCADGQVRRADNGSSCISCSPGSHANAQTWDSRADPTKETCVVCPQGSVAASYGASACLPCPTTHEAVSPGLSTCTPCSAGQTSDGQGGLCTPNPPDDTYQWVMVAVASAFGAFLTLFGIRRLRQMYLEHKRQQAEAAALITSQVQTAADAVKEFQAPCVLMKASDFVKQEALRPHEELRDKNLLLFVDTMAMLSDSVSDKCTVFFSHQWCGWSDPDPNRIQFPAMVAAIKMVAEREKRPLDQIYVWADWFSIPQACRPVQQLAIKSLPSLASSLQYFIVVAPETTHANTCVPCNQATYHKRCWCRAEMMSHWSKRGTTNMFYCSAAGLEPMAPSGITKEFLSAVHVFDGELTCCALGHQNGTVPCDREELVFPMLGLYSEIYARREEPQMKVVFDAIEPMVDSIYPNEFGYFSEKGGTVTKPLFGDLTVAMRRFVDARSQQNPVPVNLAKLRAGTTKDISLNNAGMKHGGSKHGSSSSLSLSSTKHGSTMSSVDVVSSVTPTPTPFSV